jgi:anti-sigma factor RsiW
VSETEHHRAFESLGAYALGALPEDERRFVAAHIEGCPICAEDAAGLQAAAATLIADVPLREPAPELRDRIMSVVEREAALLRSAQPGERHAAKPAPRAPWSDRLAPRWAAGAAALAAVGIVLAIVLPGGGTGGTRTLAARAGHGLARIELHGARTSLVVTGLAPPASGRVYEAWVQHGDQTPRPAAGDVARSVFVVGSGRVDLPVHLTSGDRVMVTSEPAGGSARPTSPPVVVTARA